MSEIWNKKSSKYPRFSKKLKVFNEAVFINLKDFGVDFANKSVVDIGCGTGVWTLHIASLCKDITGIDSSDGMLDMLRVDAQDNDIQNLNIVNVSWGDFVAQKYYDIAISTMSPAISDEADFLKFKDMASVKIYMNFARQRSSSLVDPFFEKFNVSGKCGLSSKKLELWLRKNGIEFKKVTFGESRVVKREKKEAFENVCWHLDINQAKYDKNDVLDILNTTYHGGILEEKIDSLISLFVF